MYFSYVHTILEYSSIVWDGCSIQLAKSVEQLQVEATYINLNGDLYSNFSNNESNVVLWGNIW